MIIKSLCDYYDVLADDREVDIPKLGYKTERISFAIEFDEEGNLVTTHELEEVEMFVPNTGSRAGSGLNPFVLFDNSKYVLGKVYNKNEYALFPEHFQSFYDKHKEIFGEIDNLASQAFFRFLDRYSKGEFDIVMEEKYPSVFVKGNIAFLFEGEYLHYNKSFKDAYENTLVLSEDSDLPLCIISGEKSIIPLTHNKIRGIAGGQAAGTSLISFNAGAYESYGKKQCDNSPISESVAHKYITTLNYLISNKENKRTISNTTILFWAVGKAEISLLNTIFGAPYEKDSDKQVEVRSDLEREIGGLISRFQKGMPIENITDMENTQFYILGLAPNNARVSIQFFYRQTAFYFVDKVTKFHYEMELEKKNEYPKYFYFYDILKSIAVNADAKNIHDNLKASLFSSIANGSLYPKTIYIKTMERIKAEASKGIGIRFTTQVSFIKAYLLRNTNYKKEEIRMALNEENKNTSYILGRLFSIFESTQYFANGSSNIRERYFSSASSNPKTIYSTLFNLYTHHLQKLNEGQKINTERIVQELVNNIDEFPNTLTLEEQGMFVLGYYHQRHADFNKPKKEEVKEMDKVE